MRFWRYSYFVSDFTFIFVANNITFLQMMIVSILLNLIHSYMLLLVFIRMIFLRHDFIYHMSFDHNYYYNFIKIILFVRRFKCLWGIAQSFCGLLCNWYETSTMCHVGIKNYCFLIWWH